MHADTLTTEKRGCGGRAHVLKCIRIGGVVDHNDAVGTAVVAAGDRAETLLARGVPYLELDGLAIQLDRPDFLRQASRCSSRISSLRYRGCQERQRTKSTPIVEMCDSV